MIRVFMPGRFCVFGEHSDWASEYKALNPDIEKGYALVIGLEEGIFLEAEKSPIFTYEYEKKSIELSKEAFVQRSEKDFFEYVISAAKIMLQEYGVFGIHITCTKTTLPIKKGLASSAAICMGVIRAFNQLYALGIDIETEMELAYKAEKEIGSKCGKLDQICAYGKGVRKIEFDSGQINISDVECNGDWHFLIVDLDGQKDTKRILSDLNRCYPFPANDRIKKLYDTLGRFNKKIVGEAVKRFAEGDSSTVGQLMMEYQRAFDKRVAPFSEELTAPLLHNLFKLLQNREEVLGCKGVGSQGDGMAQILVRDAASVEKLRGFIENELHLSCLSIDLTKEISK